jgi:hypothetical protein
MTTGGAKGIRRCNTGVLTCSHWRFCFIYEHRFGRSDLLSFMWFPFAEVVLAMRLWAVGYGRCSISDDE